jgi:probable F420-dependent oxidoreductase
MSMEPSVRPVRVGLQIPPEHSTFSEQRRVWLEAEQLGVDDLFTWDHFFPLSGDPNGRHFEAYSLLAAMAERTSRVRVGVLVTCLSYRNPDLLADMSRTIDHISDGRFVLGLGAGWAERDYLEYGYSFGTAAERLDKLDAAVPRIRERLGRLNPGPQGPMPLLIGAEGERIALRVAARHADIWNGIYEDVETFVRKDRVLRVHCDAVGRDEGTIERSVMFIGSAPLSDLDRYHAAGATHVLMEARADDTDWASVARLVAWRDAVTG